MENNNRNSEDYLEEKESSNTDFEQLHKEEISIDNDLEIPKEEAIPEVEVVEKLHLLEEKVDAMNTLFLQKIQHTAHEEKILDQMHAELQKYKDDMYFRLVKPILLDIINVRDSILRMSKNFALKPEEEQYVPLKMFRDYAIDIEDILEKNDITIFEGTEGEPFNPKRQHIIKKVKTPVEELHGKIAECLSNGYEYADKTISSAKVAVYSYELPITDRGENEK